MNRREARSEPELSPERALISGILQQAFDDCMTGRGGEDGSDPTLAYLWVLQAPQCAEYCSWLDINYERFRANVIGLAGERCERKLRERSHHAADALTAAR